MIVHVSLIIRISHLKEQPEAENVPQILANLPESSEWLLDLPQILKDLPDCSGGFQENVTHVA